MAKKLKVALVHDYLLDYGGAERVLLELHRMYPKAPIYVSLVDKKGMGKFMDLFSKAEIRKSWFHYIPFSFRLISPLRFLIPLIWNSFDYSKYDIVITSASWAVTKGVNRGDKTKEICYCHTPPRYLYGYDTSRIWKGKWYGVIVDIYSTVVNHFMRMYDFNHAQKVDYFIANSENTGKRIEKFYRRKYKVIYPPIDVEEIINSKVKQVKGDYYLTGGRMVASKNFDLIIKACKKKKVNLKLFGDGIDKEALEKLAGKSKHIEFLGRVSDDEKTAHLKGAKAFIVAQVDEDFGITPIEATAAGCPTIAYRGGGYLESVIDGKTGVFFEKMSIGSLVGAMNKLEKVNIKYSDCIKHAKKFSVERFRKEIKTYVNKHA